MINIMLIIVIRPSVLNEYLLIETVRGEERRHFTAY